MAKLYALAILAGIALLGPIVEMVVTGRVEPFSNFDLTETFLSLAPIYWWYYVDKEQRQFRTGPLLNAGVIAMTIVALPIYFIRSRGWKRGSLSTAMAAGVLAVILGLEWLGETIGTAIAS